MTRSVGLRDAREMTHTFAEPNHPLRQRLTVSRSNCNANDPQAKAVLTRPPEFAILITERLISPSLAPLTKQPCSLQ